MKIESAGEDNIIRQIKNTQTKQPKGYYYTYDQIENMKHQSYAQGFKDGYKDGTDRDTDTARLIFSINTAMYLIDNFRCKGQGLENYFDYMRHMDELNAKGLYDYKGQIETIFEETGVKIISEDNKKAQLVIEFLDLGEKEFYNRHPEVKLNHLLGGV